MSISATSSLRFRGDFIYKKADLQPNFHTEIATWGNRVFGHGVGMQPNGETNFNLIPDQPATGDLTIQIRKNRESERHDTHSKILGLIASLGIRCEFVPDKPKTDTDRQQDVTDLFQEVQKIIQPALSADPALKLPTARVNGQTLEVLVWSPSEGNLVNTALESLTKQGILKKQSTEYGSDALEFRAQQVHLVYDPASTSTLIPSWTEAEEE